MANPQSNRIITIGGGKGGVGRSFVACNLAAALAQAGARVILVDANLGGASLHTMLGVGTSRSGFLALLNNQVPTLDQAAIDTSIPNLRLVVGSTALAQPASIKHVQKKRLLRNIQNLDADIVVLDSGSDFGLMTLDVFNLGNVRFIVTTPELTALQSNFAFLKAALMRQLLQSITESDRRDGDLDTWSDSETDTLDELLTQVRERSKSLAGKLNEERANYDVRLIGNMILEAPDQGAFSALGRMAQDLLGIDCPLVAALLHSTGVPQSIRRREPVMLNNSEPVIADILRRLAMTTVRELGIVVRTPAPSANAAASARRTALGFDVEALMSGFDEPRPTSQSRPAALGEMLGDEFANQPATRGVPPSPAAIARTTEPRDAFSHESPTRGATPRTAARTIHGSAAGDFSREPATRGDSPRAAAARHSEAPAAEFDDQEIQSVAVVLQRPGKRYQAHVVEVRTADIGVVTRGEVHAGEEWTLVIEQPGLRARVPAMVVRSWPKRSMVDLQLQLREHARESLMRSLHDCLRAASEPKS